jgi:tRNA (cmo5U34)-methyltransferase
MPDASTAQDRLYATPQALVPGFEFDSQVVEVFPDMILRSVPGYSTIIQMISQLTARYAQHGTCCYDLGASLGAASFAMRQGLGAKNCRIVAVDKSPAMLSQLTQLVAAAPAGAPIQVLAESLESLALEPASVVVLNFTLQFLPIAERAPLLARIRQALVPGGVLILSEKLCFNDPRHQDLMVDLHHHFKRNQGYSDLEIAQKRQALENVLIPETLNDHRERLGAAGFDSVELWFQCFNFASLLAFANEQ